MDLRPCRAHEVALAGVLLGAHLRVRGLAHVDVPAFAAEHVDVLLLLGLLPLAGHLPADFRRPLRRLGFDFLFGLCSFVRKSLRVFPNHDGLRSFVAKSGFVLCSFFFEKSVPLATLRPSRCVLGPLLCVFFEKIVPLVVLCLFFQKGLGLCFFVAKSVGVGSCLPRHGSDLLRACGCAAPSLCLLRLVHAFFRAKKVVLRNTSVCTHLLWVFGVSGCIPPMLHLLC